MLLSIAKSRNQSLVDANFALGTMQNVRSLLICRIGRYLAKPYEASAVTICVISSPPNWLLALGRMERYERRSICTAR